MNHGKLDRTVFKIQTFKEAADHASYYATLTWQERLSIANYLNSVAYNYPENSPPKIDRTAFTIRTRNNG